MNNQHVHLQIGTRINIKRSDGRVHSALVAGINYDQMSASVEWFEQGETKGKEIDLTSIEFLNPDILIKAPSYNFQQQMATKVPQPIGSRNPSRQTMVPSAIATNNSSVRITRAASSATIQQSNAITNGHVVVSELQSSTVINQSVRRSNVVKEVEKLKKNREERRLRQAEEKAEKEAFLQMAPGNPHWELLNMISEYRRNTHLTPFTDNYTVEDHLITVCVRKRPLNKKEYARKEVDVITTLSKDQLVVHEPKNKVDLTKYLENQIFRFDYVFDEHCSNEIVYKYSAQPLVKTIFEGGFATCFAYGQTGSGKTYTMGGIFNGRNQEKGVYALAANDVFEFAKSPKYRQSKFVVSASFFEIYSGKVFDLLANKAKLRVLEDGKQQVQIVGLAEKVVTSVDEVLKLIHKGNQARTSGQTSANANSSRSHAIFQLILRTHTAMHKVFGKFSLIDLAGNERGADTSSADRQTRMEGAEINKSLLALKECIRALGRRGAHLPFRVSKLTLVLKDSFVGANSRTCMIAMISPGVSSCEHTLNTLRYADRVKELGSVETNNQNYDDCINEKPDEADLIQLQSLNEKDMTPELLNFHQMISELQIAEDIMIDNHKQALEHFVVTTERMRKLLKTTDSVEYDQEDYCRSWNEIITTTTDICTKAKKVVIDFRKKMVEEEQLSKRNRK